MYTLIPYVMKNLKNIFCYFIYVFLFIHTSCNEKQKPSKEVINNNSNNDTFYLENTGVYEGEENSLNHKYKGEIILKCLSIKDKDHKSLNKFVIKNRDYLKPFMKGLVVKFGGTEGKAEANLAKKLEEDIVYGIYTKENKQDILIGIIGGHSPHKYKLGYIDLFFCVDKNYSKNNIATWSCNKFSDILIDKYNITGINIAMRKANIGSKRVGEKIGCTELNPKENPYGLKVYGKSNWEDCFLFTKELKKEENRKVA